MDKYSAYIDVSEQLRPYFRECLLETVKSHFTDLCTKSVATAGLSYIEKTRAVQVAVMERLKPLIECPAAFNDYVLDKTVIDKLVRRVSDTENMNAFRAVTGSVFADNENEQLLAILENCLDKCVEMYLFKKITFK